MGELVGIFEGRDVIGAFVGRVDILIVGMVDGTAVVWNVGVQRFPVHGKHWE